MAIANSKGAVVRKQRLLCGGKGGSQKQPEATARTLAFAAEQLYGAGEGTAKLDYVVAELEKRGFTADRVAIEATIKEKLAALHATKDTAPVHVEIE